MSGLPNSLVEELLKFRQSRAFNVEEWTQQKITLLNEYMRKAGLKACVVSVSGGVDSACIYGMCLAAQAQPGSPIQKVLGVAQPIHSTASIWKRALECEQMGEKFGVEAKVIVVDQTPVFDQLSQIVETAANIEGQSFARGQLKSYMRTPVGYYVAQLLSQAGTPAIVMGTGNFDEDGYLCYFCKAGDGVVDVQLIADLHKSEVFQVSRQVGVPESILGARPSADLWEGQSDEDELGFSYDFVELFTEYLKLNVEERQAFEARLDEEGLQYFRETADKARQVHRRNSHKLNSPFNINILDTKLNFE